MDDSQKHLQYDMIIGQYLLLELKLDLCLSDYTISGKIGMYEGCTVYMKDTSDLCDDKIFRNEEWWESEHILDSTRRTHRILDTKRSKIRFK